MSTVIAIKKSANPTKSWLGFIKPLIVEEDGDDSPHVVKSGDFPNNDEIFVIGNYDEVNRYADDELFCVKYRTNDQELEYNDERWAAFVCHGGDVQELGKDEYFHLIDAEPNPTNRIISTAFRPSRMLMLHSVGSGMLYGPFDYDEQGTDGLVVELRLKACATLPGFSEHDPNSVYAFKASEFERLALGPQTILLANLHDLAGCNREAFDFISDEALLKIGNDLLPERERAQKSDLKTFRNSLAALADLEPKFDGARRQRLSSLVDRLDFWTARSSTLISEFIKTEDGQAQLGDYLKANQQEVLAAAEKHFHDELANKRKTLIDEIDALTSDKERLQQENQKSEAQVTSERQDQLSQELQTLQANILEKELELKVITERLRIASSVDELTIESRMAKKELEQSKTDLSDLQTQVDRLEETRQMTQRQLAESQTALREKMQDLKPLIDVLNGVLPNVGSPTSSIGTTPKRRDDQPANATELVTEVYKALNAAGRSFRFDEVANFLISIHQSFITVFAGLPGVGKTSLVTYLTDSLGMQERLLYIAVARGMTSQRDVLGFYNPLNQRYQPAPTGLYEMLRRQKDELTKFPYWVLLDEANLSPIEHYFSSFLPMCDPDNRSREIKTGDPGEGGILAVPDSVRFLATINYDDTTEPLSGRLIDRVPIIRIEPPDGDDLPSSSFPASSLGLLSQGDLDRLLLPADPWEFTDDEETAFSKVINALKATHDNNQGLPVIVSPRKKNAVRRFCSAARNLMQEKDGPALRALDYAVSQHVLPLLSGNGEQYLNRLLALQAVVQPLDRTKAHLRRIIEVGNNEHKFYRFFC